MGTGFSIDTPLKVAQFGITSTISLVDDVLIEQMRRFHSEKHGLDYVEISENDENNRANRITAYLELLDELIQNQISEMQASSFEEGSSIRRYFEMLPDSNLKKSYSDMLKISDPIEKAKMQDKLRRQIVPGDIDVNIMTKLDRDIYKDGNKLPAESADAMSALRGYATSSLSSSIIFSAGFNQRLYGYLAQFKDFFPDNNGVLRKKIILKVSDFRSAMIQGKYLAKRGLWVSEYRIESGLNCGGHAFATDGFLMGPILKEFSSKKTQLIDNLHKVYNKALTSKEKAPVESPHEMRITVQGGIGTADENKFLIEQYGLDGTGWGTPFLLVPEVTNVDEAHINKLSNAAGSDVYLSDHSPLGIPFWSLRDSASDLVRRRRIDANKPGSPCPKGYLVSNTEFTKVPICHASRVFQKRKLKQLENGHKSSQQLNAKKENVVVKACICHDLAGTATLKHKIDTIAKPSVCCGPNIVNFSKTASLEEMVSHIYGRLSLVTDSDRSHIFIKELSLYVEYLRKELEKTSEGLLDKTSKYFFEFKSNLISAIEYYQDLAEQFRLEQREKFLLELDSLFKEIEKVLPESALAPSLGTIS
jgi:hypothetical protein